MQAQGADIRALTIDEMKQFAERFSNRILDMDIERGRRAVAFINEYRDEGLLVCLNYIRSDWAENL